MSVPVDLGVFQHLRGQPFELKFLAEFDADDAIVELSTYGTTWAAQLRPSFDSTTAVDFTLDVSNIDGGVDSDPFATRLILTLASADTAALQLATYYADVQVTGGAVDPNTLYAFRVTIHGDVTRA